ncbi:MAG: hypothetical protein KDA22_03840 [Phycisphaerales bacterium]|nr:hypothetical protein [Phycisphaerales bacterium]
MRRSLTVLASSALLLAIGGCSSVVGTWAGRGSSADAPFTFGNVSFVGDRTFTAEASYGGNTRVQTGTWSTQGKDLTLDAAGTVRNYTFKVEGDMLVVTDPTSGRSVTLDRVRN